jgi:Family of unknown function (DUF5302)
MCEAGPEQEAGLTMTDKATPAIQSADASDDAGQAADQAPEAPQESNQATPDLDETKQKFRAALDRKRAAQTDGQSGSARSGDKIHGAHGPAAGRRSFRRKSG